jgi:two-component system, OmpR family, sensor kinase
VSTRGRLTAAYALLLMATLVIFSIALSATRDTRAGTIGAGVHPAADSIVMAIRSLQQQAQPDSQLLIRIGINVLDTARGTTVARPTQALIKTLDRIPGYFLVFNDENQLLYASAPMKSLSPDDQDAVNRIASRLDTHNEDVGVRLSGGEQLIMAADTVPSREIPVPHIARVVAAERISFADLLPPALTGTTIVLAPIVFLLSIIASYVVLGDVLSPVDRLINEVEAITDGRSLHRRVPSDPASNDELVRLSLTLNAMLTRLESSFAALRRFTADASHELKTPLTVLRADVERSMHPTTSRGDRMIALEEALQETARMSDLVDGLLTLARADEGRFDIHRTPVEIEPLVREVYETAVILGEDAGLQMSLSPIEGGILMGDRTRLRQLLLNLVTNAIKYTPRGGRVEVAVTRRAADEITISVRDTGIGISASDLPHVFDRFWRADRVRSRASERGGFGLGLSISQWIVQAHGGTITVQSRLGRGSVFTVVLPLGGEPSDEHVAERALEPEAATESADS